MTRKLIEQPLRKYQWARRHAVDENGDQILPDGSMRRDAPTATHAVIEVFEALGGLDGMHAWAFDNQAEFYRIWSKLIPVQVAAKVQSTVMVVQAASEKELADRLNGYLAGRAPTLPAPESDVH